MSTHGAVSTATIPPDCLVAYRGDDGTRRWLLTTSAEPRWCAAGFALRDVLASGDVAALDATAPGPHREIELLAPVDDDTEVWAAGVTYQVSRQARMEESEHSADVYAQVYEAERPELFFKALGWRVCGPGRPIGIRADSTWDVPEPELAVVCSAGGDIVGVTICNDVSSRSIEGENPLYLPQAKIYAGACALGPWIRLARSAGALTALAIEVEIRRAGATAWAGGTSTARLHRRIEDLIAFLFRAERYPHGVVLSTGTSAVPGPDVTLEPGDQVVIDVESIGRLSNVVRRGVDVR
jgi:2-dehydro-3-deoxy-D-arabinonate dehydratase